MFDTKCGQSDGSASAEPTRLGIVEDDRRVSDALLKALAQRSRYVVVGHAATVKEGLALIQKAPAVMLVDVGLPDGCGLALIARARGLDPEMKVLVFSVFDDASTVLRAIDAGADGYVLKDTRPARIIEALDAVVDGGAPISPKVAQFILARARTAQPPVRRAPLCGGPDLTPKEREVLSALARGLSVKQVAHESGLSHYTVGDHVKAIYKKLAVSSRGEAVYKAVRAGLVRLPEQA